MVLFASSSGASVKHLVSVVQILMVVTAAGLLLKARPQNGSATPPYKDPKTPVDQRVADLLGRMTLDEKVAMLAGAGWMESVANERLGIPAIKMADGPLGVRSWLGSSAVTNAPQSRVVTSTAFPAGIAMAATWDRDLVQRQGRAIGQETKALGRDMILGPTVNIARVPLWGRNFEGYGEDPYLAARLAVAFIHGVQAEGAIPSVKHFAANNAEYERHRIDETIDERTLHEIYFPAFKAAVQEGGVWSVMSAYNKVNGLYCAESPYLLRDVLKKQWGFKGFVISDWGSTYSTEGTVNAGMDLEMPGGEAMKRWSALPSTQKDGNGAGWLTPDKVLAAVAAGKISVASIDDNVGRILRVMFASGLFDKPRAPTGEVDTAEQRALARTAAAESIVLLKNAGGLLPLDTSKLRTIAVIGPNAAVAQTGGGGSSHVRPQYAVTPLDGFRERAGGKIQVTHALGVSMEGEDVSKDTPAARAQLRDEAAALAANADAAIVVVGYAPSLESEGFDRKTLDLPAGQDELIEAVAKANKNTIVVVNAGSPVTMRWIGRVPAVLDMWYGGQEGGHAIADVLFGDVNPSGKLPVTFPKEWKDSPAFRYYPGEKLHVKYGEGIYVGYRYFDTKNVEPLYPFGHGLSYTTFDYSNLKIASAKEVSVQVRNSGSRLGAEVVQLYVHQLHASVDRPAKELKGFARIVLAPGEMRTITFALDKGSLSYYSAAKKDWVAEPGAFEVLVGSSSRDIRLKGTFELAP